MLQNIHRICPIAFVYAFNCYSAHTRLFVLGGKEIRFRGTAQSEPPSMAFYAIGSLPLIWSLVECENSADQVAFADDLTGGEELKNLRRWFDHIVDKGPLFEYNAEPSKNWQ